MDIKTKHNIQDIIFFIKDAKVVDTIVRGLKIEISEGEPGKIKTDITYLCNRDPNERQIHLKVDENIAFRSKEELIKSL